MSKIYEFLKECKVFYLATTINNVPAVRPFGAVMEFNNTLYISTGKQKIVYKQLCENSNIQIVALKNGTRDWIRISGNAFETEDFHIKKMMLKACPILLNRFPTFDNPNFAVFELKNIQVLLNSDNIVSKLEN